MINLVRVPRFLQHLLSSGHHDAAYLWACLDSKAVLSAKGKNLGNVALLDIGSSLLLKLYCSEHLAG